MRGSRLLPQGAHKGASQVHKSVYQFFFFLKPDLIPGEVYRPVMCHMQFTD